MTMKKFMALPMKKKICYLWKQKRWDITLATLLIFMVGSWIWMDFIREQPLLSIEMIDAGEARSRQAAFQPFLEERGYEYTDSAVAISNRVQFDDGRPCDPNRLLFCALQSNRTDLYFWDRKELSSGLMIKSMMDLREILPPELLEQYRDQLLYSGTMLQGGYPFGICLVENDWVRDNDYYDTCIVGIADNTRDPELAGQFLTYLLSGNS